MSGLGELRMSNFNTFRGERVRYVGKDPHLKGQEGEICLED